MAFTVKQKDVPKRYNHRCLRCGWLWYGTIKKPRRCAKCRSPYWDIPRVEKK